MVEMRDWEDFERSVQCLHMIVREQQMVKVLVKQVRMVMSEERVSEMPIMRDWPDLWILQS